MKQGTTRRCESVDCDADWWPQPSLLRRLFDIAIVLYGVLGLAMLVAWSVLQFFAPASVARILNACFLVCVAAGIVLGLVRNGHWRILVDEISEALRDIGRIWRGERRPPRGCEALAQEIAKLMEEIFVRFVEELFRAALAAEAKRRIPRLVDGTVVPSRPLLEHHDPTKCDLADSRDSEQTSSASPPATLPDTPDRCPSG